MIKMHSLSLVCSSVHLEMLDLCVSANERDISEACCREGGESDYFRNLRSVWH